ncbi:hypothetical protein [Winogradskyella vincentii]|uniref:Leucine-rich repeat domain-containing protein n=1 Tax=Winogradskyella vincentii TaxID=2877122 RepID=A0ABS7Y2C8_9FLAO|nr:hypothetical protein [Winogradskyella vincentii]MCA0154105.1 hypothetical protein [Winogradskyella vincentii]
MKNLILILVSLLLMTCSKDNDIVEDMDLSLYTYVPDDNFEEFLIIKGYDDKMDNYVLTRNIEDIKELNASQGYGWSITGYGIRDLTGLQDFSSLEILNVQHNYITALDLSQNTALKYLDCSANFGLIQLDISRNLNLIYLECEHIFNLECIQANQFQIENLDYKIDPETYLSIDCNYQ